MIELNINDMKDTERHSSKGNQLKWNPANTETWYKADYIGYEGLTEYMVSHLLMHSTLSTNDFVLYDTEILRVGKKDYLGCKSSNFLPDGWQLLTLERLFHTLHGKSLYQSIFQFGEVEDRAQFLVDQVIQMTGLKAFGKYLCTLLTIDALFLNEEFQFQWTNNRNPFKRRKILFNRYKNKSSRYYITTKKILSVFIFISKKGSEPLPFLPSHSISRPIIPSVARIPYLSSRSLYQIP